MACEGYRPALVRTGYEQVIANRTSDLFAATAKKSGKVVALTEKGIIIEYDDGDRLAVELGRRFGKSSDLHIPHNVVTDMKLGQKVKEGDVVAYNTNFFFKDRLNPDGVSMSMSLTAKVVLLESTKTLDDSSAISEKLAEKLKTKIGYSRAIVVNFKDSVEKLVKVGDQLTSESILCYIQDEVTARSGAFDEDTIDTLRMLSAQSPQAKHRGIVEKIEVFYHGDKEDMSATLKAIANASDRELAVKMKSLGQKPVTGSVDNTYRIDGAPLQLDTLVIRVYITDLVPAGIGDKGVFANQLKTVFCDVMKHPYVSESGVEIDAVFGNKSVFNRIVNSPYLIGTATTLLKIIGRKAVSAYRNA